MVDNSPFLTFSTTQQMNRMDTKKALLLKEKQGFVIVGVIGFEPESNFEVTDCQARTCENDSAIGAANALQLDCTSCPKSVTTDPHLQTIISAWPSLSDRTKLQILGVLAADFVQRLPSQ
jgi:hypothetical protein